MRIMYCFWQNPVPSFIRKLFQNAFPVKRHAVAYRDDPDCGIHISLLIADIMVHPVVEKDFWNPDSLMGFCTLEKNSSMKINSVNSVRIQNDPTILQPTLTFRMNSEEAKRFAALTAENVG